MACENSLLMGDVVADQTYTIEIYDAIETLIDTVTIGKGSWFASPWVFWAYLYELSGAPGPEPGADFLPTVSDTDRRLQLYFDATYRTTITPDTGTMLTEIGWPGDVQSASTDPWPYSWKTTFLVNSYTRGVDIHGGSSTRAHDGTAYTVSGVPQETRTLSLTLDRRSGSFEAEQLLNLHRSHWRAGRSVAFYPIDDITDNYPTYSPSAATPTVGNPGAGYFESLVLPARGEVRWRPSRLVGQAERVDLEEGTKFFVRQSVPVNASATYRVV